MVHFTACMWIYLGRRDLDPETVEKRSWLSVKGNEFEDQSWHAIYLFSFYWIFEVLATVGYGEFSGSTNGEYWFCVMIEFLGVMFIAILTGFLAKVIGNDDSFQGFITSRMDAIDTWALKLEKSNKPRFLHSKLYSEITQNVQNAMQFDFNLIIEEFEFYQQLTPRMQTELINEVFIDF